MNIVGILKNKFVLSLIISLILLFCLYQFDKIKSESAVQEEGDNKEDKNIIYYCKYLVLFYILSFILVLVISKGYEYYIKNNLQLVSKKTEVNVDKVNEDERKKKLLEERKKILELKKKQEQNTQTGGKKEPVKSFTIETIDETKAKKIESIQDKLDKEKPAELENTKKEQTFNMGNPNF